MYGSKGFGSVAAYSGGGGASASDALAAISAARPGLLPAGGGDALAAVRAVLAALFAELGLPRPPPDAAAAGGADGDAAAVDIECVSRGVRGSDSARLAPRVSRAAASCASRRHDRLARRPPPARSARAASTRSLLRCTPRAPWTPFA
jgi:hypothetical protein